MTRIAGAACALTLCALSAAALAQPAAGPLGAPAAAKVATPPSAPTAKAGSGGGASDPAPNPGPEFAPPPRPIVLSKAPPEPPDTPVVTRMREILRGGGSAQDVAKVMVADQLEAGAWREGSLLIPDPSTARWTQGPGGTLALSMMTNGGIPVGFSNAAIRDYTPPGGIAALPTREEAFGRPSPETLAKAFPGAPSGQ